MKVLFNLLGDRDKASSRVRGFSIADELDRLGHSCTLHVARTKLDYARCATLVASHDVVVFQKTYSRYDLMLIRLANQLGKPTFFDIDDAPSRVQDPRTMKRAAAMMRLANGVLAGSAELVALAHVHQPSTYLLPSGIRLADYPPAAPRRAEHRLCLGWIGNGAHYADDLVRLLQAPLRRLSAERPLRLKVVGACGEQRLHEAFASIEGLETTLVDQIAWSRPDAVSEAVADFDIGLYPLLDNDFNRYKCAFKALEYMARGIPVISSRAHCTIGLVAHAENGLLVESDKEWVSGLSALIGDAGLRERLGRAGRATVLGGYTTERIAGQLERIFDELRLGVGRAA